MVDAAARHDDRFPSTLLDDVRSVLTAEIDSITKIAKPELAVSSLAAGGDMIFAEEMLAREIPLIIFLPFEIERFLPVSVTYEKKSSDQNPEQWAFQFHNIIKQAREIIITGTPNDPQEEAFAACNETMLAYALARTGNNPKQILTVALVKTPDVRRGGSSEFVTQLRERHIGVRQVWPEVDRPTN